MLDIERHIEILLLTNDCVIVPGFGGFLAHYDSARYDDRDGVFLPPLRTAQFNEGLKQNDSLLAGSFVEAYDISYPEALRRIEDEVSSLQSRLANEGEYEINGMGMLRRGATGNIVFEPSEAGLLSPTLYGLSSFEFGRAADATASDQTAQHTAASPQCESPASTAGQPTSTADDEDVVKIKLSWIKNIAAAAAAILVFFVINTPILNTGSKQQTANILPVSPAIEAAQTTATTAEPTAKAPKQKTAQAPAKTTITPNATAGHKTAEPKTTANKQPAAAEKATAVEAVSEEKAEYVIVLASQTSTLGADRYVAELQAKGIKSARSLKASRGTSVVCGSYATREEASTALRELRQTGGYDDAWVRQCRNRH